MRMQQDPRLGLASVLAGFAVDGPAGPIEPLGKGLINLSFRVSAGGRDWVLQRLNGEVFAHPERIMANLRLLAGQGARASTLGLKIPALVPGRDGSPFVRGADGSLWRLMELIPDAITLARLESSHQAREVGRVLGRFHRLAADLPREGLEVSLPGFHHTPTYLARHLRARGLAQDLADTDPAALEDCLDQVDARRDLAEVLETARARGRVAERVIHGDPKLDNILFDATGGRALALIDLDTVQPGLIQQDLGDCLRSCCNRMGESPQGRARPAFDLGLCAAILGGYGQEAASLLRRGDIEVLYDSIRLLPFELALRFLTDHLEGDRYFRVDHRGQNLEKARTQLDLLADIELKEPAIRRIIADAFAPS
ncbi:MAG: aminoglycoside phosphotransferase family protein [Chromatiaceae bacterium]